jgi:hypothetical protein
MAFFSWDCPHASCRARKSAFNSVYVVFGEEDKRTYAVGICPICKKPTLFAIETKPAGKNVSLYFSQNWHGDALGPSARQQAGTQNLGHYEIVETMPAPDTVEVPPNTPPRVADAFTEGLQARAAGLVSSAVYNLRKAVERAVKDKHPSGSGMLKARITALAAAQNLPTTLVELFHTVRAEGNVEVHEDETWTPEQVSELIEFTRLLLVYLYTLPAQIDAIATHRGAAPGAR